ncbi:MAG: TolC family protein, partial [Acidobacteria bacterium]|nr:TolC family protein [Acidobacteriota bacterium]
QDVRVKQQALALADKLYNDNKKQVEIGTLAPIEIVRAEAQVASSQQDLTISETNVLQQETIIKNALSRTGVANPAVATAHIIPTDRIRVPAMEAIQPAQDLMSQALVVRPEVEQNRLAITNSKINLKASKNALLPSLNAFATLTNNALAGQINALPVSGGTGLARDPSAVDGFFIGGYGTVLGQLFRRNFPDYSLGVQLNIPLRNRAAQADVLSSELGLRQQELNQQRLVNQIRVEVQNAMIAVLQARARYQASVKNRILGEQTFDAEQKKYQLGASTIYQVIQTQRDLSAAQSAEVTALSNYSRARVELERATGQTLAVNGIDIREATRGEVARPPSALPLTTPGSPAK